MLFVLYRRKEKWRQAQYQSAKELELAEFYLLKRFFSIFWHGKKEWCRRRRKRRYRIFPPYITPDQHHQLYSVIHEIHIQLWEQILKHDFITWTSFDGFYFAYPHIFSRHWFTTSIDIEKLIDNIYVYWYFSKILPFSKWPFTFLVGHYN